jgi:uncharacterized protein YdaT
MKRNFVHVTRQGAQWNVVREGASRPSSTHRTQGAAITRAEKIAKPEHGEVLIHGRDNKIRDRSSYGNDPCPPKG